jgi:hypothetical protein
MTHHVTLKLPRDHPFLSETLGVDDGFRLTDPLFVLVGRGWARLRTGHGLSHHPVNRASCRRVDLGIAGGYRWASYRLYKGSIPGVPGTPVYMGCIPGVPGIFGSQTRPDILGILGLHTGRSGSSLMTKDRCFSI